MKPRHRGLWRSLVFHVIQKRVILQKATRGWRIWGLVTFLVLRWLFLTVPIPGGRQQLLRGTQSLFWELCCLPASLEGLWGEAGEEWPKCRQEFRLWWRLEFMERRFSGASISNPQWGKLGKVCPVSLLLCWSKSLKWELKRFSESLESIFWKGLMVRDCVRDR